jgi:osmotically inducible protein OsmC
MKITKMGSAEWSGSLKEGRGTVSTESGALKHTPYDFNTRFEGVVGTNPEELLGAAHAACFTMALSKMLGELDLAATMLATNAQVSLEKVGDTFEITAIHLDLKGVVPGLNQEKFQELATKAKEGCPVSKLFRGARITLEAMLQSSP